jgi:outer membrane protein
MMKLNLLPVMAALAASAIGAPAFAQSKVGIVNVQAAIVGTKDGQKAAGELQTRTAPKQKTLEAAQGEIQSLQAQLSKGSNTMSEEQRLKLTRDIDQKTKSFQRQYEDAKAEFDSDEQKVLQELGQRMMAVIDKYAKDNSFTMIMDVSSPQNPVIYAADSIDVTKQIIELYDKNAPTTPTAAPKSAAVPPSGAPAAPKKAPGIVK